jgi:WD40 repeat protein
MKRFWILFAVVVFISTTNLFSQLSFEVVWEKPQAGVIDAKFSPDGKFIYCAVGKTIKKLDVETGEFISTFDNSLSPFIYAVMSMNISDDGKYIATQNGAGAIDIWDTEQQKLTKELQLGTTMASFTKDNVLLIASAKDESKGIILYDYLNDRYLDTISYSPIIKLIYTSKDGKYFISGSVYWDWQDNGFCKVTLWDANTLKPIRDYEVPEGNDAGFRKIQISDNNKLIGLATHNTNIVKILETETGMVVKTSDKDMVGYNFDLLPNDYYFLCQWKEGTEIDYDILIYKYPDIYQSNIYKMFGGVILSKEFIEGSEKKMIVFQQSGQLMTLLTNSTTSVNEPSNTEFRIKVEPEKISVNFDNAESIKILDIKGKILFYQKVNEPNFFIPNTFSPGTYICVVKLGDREYSQKFQVVR